MFQLFNIKKSSTELVTWSKFKEWLQLLLGNNDPISLSAIQKSVTTLQSKQRDLQKRAKEVDTLLEEPYRLPGYQPRKAAVPKSKAPSQSTFIKEVIALVNKDLAVQNAKLTQKCEIGEKLLLIQGEGTLKTQRESQSM